MDNGQTNNQGVNPFMPTGPETGFQENSVNAEETPESQEIQDTSTPLDTQEIGKTAIGASVEVEVPQEEGITNFGEITPVMPPGYNVDFQTNEQQTTDRVNQKEPKPAIHSPEKLGPKLEEEAGTNPAGFYEELLGARGELSEKGAKNDH